MKQACRSTAYCIVHSDARYYVILFDEFFYNSTWFYIQYSWKIWWELNLALWPQPAWIKILAPAHALELTVIDCREWLAGQIPVCTSVNWARNMESKLATESCIRGLHVFKNIWTPTISKRLPCERNWQWSVRSSSTSRLHHSWTHTSEDISCLCTVFLDGRLYSLSSQENIEIYCVVWLHLHACAVPYEWHNTDRF